MTYNTYQWNSPTRVTLPGGTRTDYTYDPLMQLRSIGVKDPAGNSVLTREYQYSPVGNITAKNTEHGNYTYQYDALYRLTGATNPGSTNESYTYDALGNRLTSAATTGEWAYNRNNELLGYDSVSYAYDENGNMTGKTAAGEARSYAYDVEDRLVRVEDGQGGAVAEYGYDPFGRRLWKEVSGVRTYFLYSDEGLVGEYDGGGQEIRTYGYEPDSTWSTNPVFLKVGGAYYFYENDHLGTPQKLVSTTGAVVWAATYDSFGNCRITTEVVTSNLRLGGQYYDAETGLYYNWNRYYDPALGRYLQPDPYQDGSNLYAYCSGNPINYMDPEGLCAAKKVGAWIKKAAWRAVAYAYYQATGGPLRDFLRTMMYAYGPDWMINGYEGIVTGRYFGTGYGEEAAQWYADQYNATGDWCYYAGGALASLWTPDTWFATASTLAAAYGASQALVARGAAATGAAGTADAMSAVRLRAQLASEEAMSAFTAEGRLSQEALSGAREIIPRSQLRPAIPQGFNKYATQTFQSPSGPFQVHFYMNPQTGEVLYNLEYKALFNAGVPRPL